MRTGLTKKQKTTVSYFDEHSRIIEVQTHNTDFKKRLAAFAAKHPQCCRQTDDDEQGGLTFDIEKGRLSLCLQPLRIGRQKCLFVPLHQPKGADADRHDGHSLQGDVGAEQP